MKKYLVTNIYKYTATVEVEAEDETEAMQKALGLPDERNQDDWLYDSEVKETMVQEQKKS